MEYLSFAFGYFAVLAAITFFTAAYMRSTGAMLFGLTADRITNVAISFGAVHAIVSVASLLVPPTGPVMTTLLGIATVSLAISLILREKLSSGQRNFLWLVGNIFGVSGVSFESARYLSEASLITVAAPVAIIVLASIVIARTALQLPVKPVGTAA